MILEVVFGSLYEENKCPNIRASNDYNPSFLTVVIIPGKVPAIRNFLISLLNIRAISCFTVFKL